MALDLRRSALVFSALLCLSAAATSHANLITNGTFDTDLTGWTVGGEIPTTWIAGTAHLGRPGTPGTSTFSQAFAASENLAVAFDYQWQVNPPTSPDFFSAYILFEGTGGASRLNLIDQQSSAAATFGTTASPTFSATLTDLTSANATLVFELVENNSPVGTRIQLDNVSINAVPLPATLWLAGVGIVVLAAIRRKRAWR
jgi:hypothetical protein